MDRRRLIQICVFASALAVAVAVAILPWRTVLLVSRSRFQGEQILTPSQGGARLYQMHLPIYLGSLLILAAFAAVAGLVLDRGRWPSRVIFASGVGIVMLTLLIGAHPDPDDLIGSNPQVQPGNTVALVGGLIIAVAGAWWIFMRTRTANRTAPA